MSEQFEKNAGLSRRTMVKGAAWSVPVLAAAVATPAFAASNVNEDLDVTVSGYCTGQYDIESLRTLLGGVNLGATAALGLTLTGLVDVVKAALSAIGINDNARRGFTVNVGGDVLPANSTFVLATAPELSLVNLELLKGVVDAQVGFVATVNGSGLTVQTSTDLPAGSSFDFNFTEGILDVDALTTTSFTFSPATDTTVAGEGADSASITTLVGTPVNLGQLNLGSVLVAVLGETLAGLVGGLIGTVILPQLDDLDLRVQVCQ